MANCIKASRRHGPYAVWNQDIFLSLITMEQRRAERSNDPCVLMLLDVKNAGQLGEGILHAALPAVASSTREADLIGWTDKPRELGVIFTLLDAARRDAIMTSLLAKCEGALRGALGREEAAKIAISMHIFPADARNCEAGWHSVEKFVPVFSGRADAAPHVAPGSSRPRFLSWGRRWVAGVVERGSGLAGRPQTAGRGSESSG